jgi:hypothetical protein
MPRHLLSSGLNFCAGFITGLTFFYIHSKSASSQYYDETRLNLPPLLCAYSIPVPAPVTVHEPVQVQPIVPVPVSVPSRPLPTEGSTRLSVENHTLDEEVFPKSMKNLFHRMGRVSRKSFAAKFDIGYGLDKSFEENSEILILYGSERSLPTNYHMDGSTVVPHQRVSDATENCDV